MMKTAQLVTCIFLVACLIGCTNKSSVPIHKLSDLQSLSNKNTHQERPEALTGIRYAALRDTALSIGARGGLAWRAQQINDMLLDHQLDLDQIFAFEQLILNNRVLPPVLIEGRHTLEKTDNQNLRVADRSYAIERQAQFITTAPTWREYLWLEYKEPELPDRTLLPRDRTEKKIWSTYMEQGWQAGLLQADNIYAQNLNRLQRDYQGMLRYRTLLAQNMVTAPFVTRLNLGITGGGNEMAVNDRILRITALPTLNSDGAEWQTTVTSESSDTR